MSERTYTRRELQELQGAWRPKKPVPLPLWTLYAVTARHRTLFLTRGPDPEAQLRRILDRRPEEPGRRVEELGRLEDAGERVSGWVTRLRVTACQ